MTPSLIYSFFIKKKKASVSRPGSEASMNVDRSGNIKAYGGLRTRDRNKHA